MYLDGSCFFMQTKHMFEFFLTYRYCDTIIIIINNGIIYIGRSAGAHIATNNIKHVLEFDSNDIGTNDYDGLGLVDCILVCHYDTERKNCYDRLINESGYNVYSLTNQEILIYDGMEIKKYCSRCNKMTVHKEKK